MNSLSRATALKTAAVLSFLGNLYSVVMSLPFIVRGAEAVNNDPEAIPYAVLLLALVLGVVGIIAAYGAWKQQRWGIILTIVTTLLNGLSAAPGILFAPTTGMFISATLGVILSVVIIVLCLWPDRKLAAA